MRFVVALALAACGGARTPAEPPAMPAPEPPRTLRFDPVVPGPELAAAKMPVATSRAVVRGTEVPIGFHVLYRAGQDGFGTVRALDGVTPVEPPCWEQDSNTLHLVGGKPLLVSHFECVPGAVYVTELAQEPDGNLRPVATMPVSFDAWGGVWNPCAGMASPWGTHLGSEEYEPDGRFWNPADGTLTPDAFEAWAGMRRAYTDPTQANPYRYGWATEVRVAEDGSAQAQKHYALGRFSHELSYALPDGRTVYQSDDGGSTGWFLFVADRAQDLSSGVLYAAVFEPHEGPPAEGGGGEELGISWLALGHATHAEIAALVDARITFADLFDVAEPGEGGACAEGFAYARHMYGRECLALRPPSAKVPDPAKAASRLETRRYAAMLGATTELEKGEGMAFDPETGRIYFALSSQSRSMTAEPDEPVDVIRLAKNPCGAVFAADTSPRMTDRSGTPIDSPHVAARLRTELAGAVLPAPDAAGNRCDPARIANPDNVTFLPGYGILVVAEDTRAHANAVLWSWDVRTKELVPILVSPPGGEMTGISWTRDLLGHGYLTAVVQHPWGVEDPPPGITEDDVRAITGYLGPFPPLD